ncbi:phosphatidate cytidylyltransferase [Candidatus Dependentiae bacterium]|nr:phosphatidate cytidylyltransferase [Candidatus Dependentiae bacterium]
MKKSNLIKRFLVALVFIPGLIYLFYIGGIAFSISIAIISLLAYYEFLMGSLKIKSKKVVSVIVILAALLFQYRFIVNIFHLTDSGSLASFHGIALMAWLLLIFILFFLSFFYLNKKNLPSMINDFGMIVSGFFYTQVLLFTLPLLREFIPNNNGFHVILFILIMIWINDSLAFFGGSLFGKHKLVPTISPNKTVEGFLTTLFLTPVFAVIFHLIFKYPGSILKAALLGAVVSFFAMYGDLIESALKRSLGIKDFGNLLPGHGGFLDRIDSVLVVAPVFFIWYFFGGILSGIKWFF